MEKQSNSTPTVGFIGLGAMGGGMARNLLKAGYPLIAFDLDEKRRDEIRAEGAAIAVDPAGAAHKAAVVFTSLPNSEVFVSVAERQLLPDARAGQLFIDTGTVTVAETQRLAREFHNRGAALLDAPVSGGVEGARDGTLRIFVGGDAGAFERAIPLLRCLGNSVTHCGPAGMGQIVKGVNQLAMGLGEAAYLEAVAFGVRAGADPATIRDAVGGNDGWRRQVADTAQRILDGTACRVGVKSLQLPYFLEVAREAGFELPLARALYDFCKDGPRTVMEANRLSPSFWDELRSRRR